jgi:hypothetical protein
MITATIVKKEYRLNDQDLQLLPVVTTRNPHYRNGPPMRLYSLKLVKAVSDSKMERLQTTLEEQKRKSEKRAEAIKRTNSQRQNGDGMT